MEDEYRQEFDVYSNEYILDAAHRSGVRLPHSCHSGTCRTCMMEVVQGEVVQDDAHKRQISEDELNRGRRLICTSSAESDAVLRRAPKRKWYEV